MASLALRTGSIRSLKLHSLSSRKLDQETSHEVFDLWQQNVNGNNSYEDFLKLHHSFGQTLIMRDHSNSGRICAMMCYSAVPTNLKQNSRRIHILTPGAGYILPEYQRKGILHNFFLHMTLKEKLLRPFSPLYMAANFLTYKIYPAFIRFSSGQAYPQYDRLTPALEQKIIDYYAEQYLKCGDTYNRERGVVRLTQSAKDEVGFIDEKYLKNPHIKYYAERTNWTKGEALLGVAKVSWKTIASIYSNWK